MPPRFSPRDSVEFAAPIGLRVRVITLGALAVIGMAAIVAPVLPEILHRSRDVFGLAVFVPLLALAIIASVVFFQRIRQYRVADEMLEVVRPGRVNRFALADLQTVDADPDAMAWSFKMRGNDGLGAITGRYRNRKLGVFQAPVTDRERAVVLRWPEHTLVVSPERPLEFVDEVRARAGLRG